MSSPKMSRIAPVVGTPYLFLPQASALVVADLHIGIEAALHLEGVHLLSSTKKKVEDAIKAGKRCGAETLYLLGDVKHTVAGFSPGELKEVLYALERFTEEFDRVYIIPGNHDGGLSDVTLNLDIVYLKARGVLVGGVTLLHGHAMPPPDILGNLIVVGHDHPRVLLRDSLGISTTKRCWMKAPLKGELSGKKLVIMPPAERHSGQIVNEHPPQLLNIFFRRGLMDLKKAEIFLLDGTYLGYLHQLVPRRSGDR